MRAQEFVTESTTVERNGVNIQYEFHKAHPASKNKRLYIKALSGGKELGRVEFMQIVDDSGQPAWEGDELYVDDRFRGQGIARIMYDFAKEKLGRIVPSNAQTDDGRSFWKGKEVWEE